MTELSTNKTAPKAGTAGFSRLTTDNLEEITEKLCTIDLVLLSRTYTELKNVAEKVEKGFSRLTTDNLEQITAKLCTIDLVLLSRTSTELNNMVEKVAKERVGQLIQNKEITGIRTPIEHMSKKQLIAIICVNEEKP